MIRATPNSIILEDFNAHSSLWDPMQPSDACENELQERISDIDLPALNDGSPQVVWQATTALQIIHSVVEFGLRKYFGLFWNR